MFWVGLECSGFYRSFPLVGCYDYAFGRGFGFGEFEGGWCCAFSEEAFAGSKCDGVDFQSKFIDEVVFEECLDEV